MLWAITASNYHYLFCRQHHHQNLFCQHQIQVRHRGERQIARNTALEWQVQCTCDRYTHDSVITIYVIYMIHIFTINVQVQLLCDPPCHWASQCQCSLPPVPKDIWCSLYRGMQCIVCILCILCTHIYLHQQFPKISGAPCTEVCTHINLHRPGKI